MKKVILLAVVLSITATAAEGYLGQVVSFWQSPVRGVRGLAVGPQYMYVLIPRTRVYTCNLTNGSVIRSWAVTQYETHGLGYQNPGYIWDRWGYAPYNGKTLKRRESDGVILGSFSLDHQVDTGGLTCQGDPDVPNSVTAIMSTRGYRVARYTTGGSFINSFSYSGVGYPADPAWDYRDNLLWVPDFNVNAYVHGFTTTGSRVASFPVPRYSSHDTRASASCYKSEYLYIAGDIEGMVFSLVWKVHCPFPVTVRPASLGKVKALYR